MKTAIITGASRGIGKAIAERLAKLGYRLALIARDEKKLQAVPGDHLRYSLDVSDEKAVHTAVADISRQVDSVDVLVNAAGILHTQTSSISSEDLRSLIEINLFGSIYFMQAIAPIMQKQQSGYIFNIGSRAGKNGVSSLGGYAASKFGLVGYSESLSLELAVDNIKVTSINPGWVDTDMARENTASPPEEMIQIQDIADTIEYLLGLSSHCAIQEITLKCQGSLISAGKSTVKQ
ncbi:MAG: 3-oxoacyl-[acyl-carrier-protein] reductase FabG [Chlamydiia bacterium]|nr:3-oxoacyl-[acyl-carrier-protein] reductase FabG [Chlamydiia bacterium]MCH9616235.1 3-oxoacyl-[acyl-carrier-protein] reductase FabG [Chlamydiia bacterium]MCH9629779.1 3-oxoacyl-[acyl-carrier-protein] reductase FabG [Chlamydiia bacterium]